MSQPTGFHELEHQLSEVIGFRLFTVLQVDLPEVVRLYSSNREAYQVTGRKLMGPTPWGAHVIIEGQPWLGHTAADLKWAFPDYALIASLGCGSCLSIPVRENDQTLGTLNILDAEGRYTQDDLIRASAYATSAIPLFKCV
ncbi:GAF domain-containing protein [Paracoccaceae bacterium]|nr:GAF domain-containing protein [Paracoccaceae bacterium]